MSPVGGSPVRRLFYYDLKLDHDPVLMSSARRRTISNNDRVDHNLVKQSIKNKPRARIILQRRAYGNLDELQLPSSISSRLPMVPRADRKLIFGVTAILLIIIYMRAAGMLTTTNTQLGDPITSGQPFPNTASLTPQGRIALQKLSLESVQAPPSQVTFVFSIQKHEARGTLSLISRLQRLDCQIHILVPLNQATELDYLLDTLLTTRNNLRIYPGAVDNVGAALGMLHHAKHVGTPWVWIMSGNHRGQLQDVEAWMDRIALKIPRVQVLTGIYGARITEFGVSCVSSTDRAQPVAFLVPPFLAPTSLLVGSEPGIVADTEANVWASLGERIARITNLGMGGVVVGSAYSSPGECKMSRMGGLRGALDVSKDLITTLRAQFRYPTTGGLQFAFLLPNLTSLKRIAPTICRVLQNGHELSITVQESSNTKRVGSSRQQYLNHGCHFHYTMNPDTGSGYDEDIIALGDNWCNPASSKDKILIVGGDINSLRYGLVPKRQICATAAIHLPDRDLESAEWLSMLTPEEWRAWDEPAIELAVITHDRPWSLRRLLNSVKQAHYFGDAVNMVINLEQTSDEETRQIAEEFTMGTTSGHVSVRHRIVYAGLMTAVVESWYPHGNHSYGVMLEDDVELSPLFYAWIKFCVLRYRYGAPAKDASQLYGISLYQPKVTELHTQGRRPFNARDMFAMANIEHPHTPYLSQVPCSWGAVYFPEHWREFKRYLSLRLSEHIIPATDIIVPNLRSNRWSRSWKKFFNEMVYLRGYVSLYPNYEYFVSLSTNHLEAGEHVPANIDKEKQSQYLLPLMREPEVAKHYPGTELGVKLLDLPLSNLPNWADLPVLDLWGDISSLEQLRRIGLERRVNMSVCQPDETQESALEYLCPPKNILRSTSSRKALDVSPNEDDDPDLMQG
ncbi:hypothetical protein OPQ81_007771 [Rhizoctonia solani]|nr:hypothetical protein OPQ81_007771 [Rhizoctonia solani]